MTDPAVDPPSTLDDLLIQALAYEWGRDEKNSIAALVHGLATHAARIPQLQAMLDARAADLGRFTQSAVAKTKELEAQLAAARTVIREIIDDDCSYEQGTATHRWNEIETEAIVQAVRSNDD